MKPLLSVLDPQPLLDDEMLRLAQWLRERTFCTVFDDAVRAMLPTGLYMRIAVVPGGDISARFGYRRAFCGGKGAVGDREALPEGGLPATGCCTGTV